MLVLFLHGLTSTPHGIKPTYLEDHGHEVLCPPLPDDDFDVAVQVAQNEFDRQHPAVIVGSSRGGAVAMNMQSGSTPMVLLCPAWKRWGTATTVKPGTVIVHSRADDVVPFADSEEVLRNGGLSAESLIEVGNDHRLADLESLAAMLEAVERAGSIAESSTRSPSSATRRKGRLKWTLVSLLIAYVAVQCILSGITFVHDRRLERQAKQLFAQAQEDAKPTWTEDDAVRWLTEHGIRPYRGEQSGTGGHCLIVDGYQQIETGGTLISPASVKIAFLFDLDHRFARVEYKLCRFTGPWLRVTGK